MEYFAHAEQNAFLQASNKLNVKNPYDPYLCGRHVRATLKKFSIFLDRIAQRLCAIERRS